MSSKRRGPLGGPELRPVMVRLPEKLRQRLAQLADEAGRSMNAEIIHRLEQATEGPSVSERLAAIERDLQAFWRTLQAQQRVMQQQDDMLASPREELHQIRTELQQIRGALHDLLMRPLQPPEPPEGEQP